MAQTIKLRRGTEAARQTLSAGSAPVVGEVLYTTDNLEIFLGDGSTTGGLDIGYLKLRDTGSPQTVGGDVIISGNLTIQGTTTSVNSTEVNIGDNIIILNSGETEAPTLDAGFQIERGSADNVSILWNEASNQWELTKDSNDDTGTGTSTKRILDADDILTPGTGLVNNAGTWSLDFSELIDKTTVISGTDELILQSVGVESRKAVSEIDLSAFNNDAGWTSNTGTVTSVSGTGTVSGITLTGSVTTSGNLTLGGTLLVTESELDVSSAGTAGQALVSDGDGTFSWQSISGTTNLSIGTVTTTTVDIDSSTGTSATIPQAIATTAAGLMSGADKAKLDAISGTNTGDEVSATTTVQGIVELATTTETDAGADTTRAVTPASLTNVLADVAANNAKVSNVTTNLSYTASATQGIVVSSDGTDATIPAGSTANASLMLPGDKTKLDAISGTNTGDEVTATTTVQGIVELATTAEIDAGTAGALAMTPSAFATATIDGGTF